MTACSLCGCTPGAAAGDDVPAGAVASSEGVAYADAGDVPAASPEPLPLSWVTSWENAQLKVYCPTCARTHLRAIEAKLDSAWW